MEGLLSWMLHKGAFTEIYFKAEEWRWTLSEDKEWLKIEEEGEARWSQKHKSTHQCCRIKENQTPVNAEMIRIVGQLSKQNKLITSGQDTTIENNQAESVDPS